MKNVATLPLLLLFIAGSFAGRAVTSPRAAQQGPITRQIHLAKMNAADSARPNSHYYNTRLTVGVDSLCAIKHRRELYAYRHDSLLKVYRFALGDAPEGHKHFQGDERTPEGLYTINDKNAHSTCHKNLGISYPNAADRAYATRNGKAPGGDIKIHGLPNGQGYIGKAHLLHDWTNGCMGLTDEEIDELFKHVPVGIPILILP